ncbi:hypothetical protein J1605_020032 [Eschrichtius robustus]|uniref:Uncharacterized protein n=1 Tax=Eschrichtius robustus TaxID=9764 RepID=A0AB34HKG4_ESCRO|nr:hypothetical protein J1605_020032 [Eschrichtius robustus]
MVEMVCLHVISLMEALQECNSTIFVKVGKSYDFYRPYLASKSKSDTYVVANDSVKYQGKSPPGVLEAQFPPEKLVTFTGLHNAPLITCSWSLGADNAGDPAGQHLSAGLQLRLQAIQNNVDHHSLRTLPGSTQSSASLAALRKWLQCTQFKMAQVEIQSSEAASQFYPL